MSAFDPFPDSTRLHAVEWEAD